MTSWTQEVDSKNLSIKFVNFQRKYEILSDLTSMQTLNFSTLLNDELEESVSKIPELKEFHFYRGKKCLTNRLKLSFCSAKLGIDKSTRNYFC